MLCEIEIPIKTLRDLLHLETNTGMLFWKTRSCSYFLDERQWKRWNTRYAGKEAFANIHITGYKYGKVLRQSHKAHRIVYALYNGKWPDKFIDHVNGMRADNRPTNLRLANNFENTQNAKTRVDNTSGFKGVSWHKNHRKWCARISVDGKRMHLGLFDNKLGAAFCYADAALKYHGEFACYNKVDGDRYETRDEPCHCPLGEIT